MLSNSRLLSFRIDPLLPQNLRRSLDAALFHFQGSTIEELKGWQHEAQGQLTVDFISESSLHLLKQGGSFKICILDRNQGLFSFGENLDSSHIDACLLYTSPS